MFDSGLGGLTVFREIVAARPDARFVYVADDAGFPYGNQPEGALIARIIDVVGEAIAAHAPDLVVVACNTASTLALSELRARFAVPFVGTVPAIKPACAQSVSKRVAVLGTQATVGREYTRTLIREFAGGCDVALIGSSRLAGFAEAELAGEPVADANIAEEIAGCFVDEGESRTDIVVLACTHYPLLIDRFRKARALAGRLARSGAGDRPPRGRSDRPSDRQAGGSCTRHRFHVATRAFVRARNIIDRIWFRAWLSALVLRAMLLQAGNTAVRHRREVVAVAGGFLAVRGRTRRAIVAGFGSVPRRAGGSRVRGHVLWAADTGRGRGDDE